MKFTAHPLSSPDVMKQFRHIRPDAALVARLQQSLAVLRPLADAITTTFYSNLFTSYPMLRGMFPTDMTGQRRKLFESLEFVVSHLDQPENVRPALAEMGRRHVGYGAKPEHYPIVRDFLVNAMATVVGQDWNHTLQADWLVAIDLVGAAMQKH